MARGEGGPALVLAEAPLQERDDAPRRSAAARLAVGELSPGRYVAGVRVVRRGDEVTRIDRPSRIADQRGGGCGNPALGGSRWAESVRQDDTIALDVSRRRLRRRAGARPGGCHRACDR